MKLSLKSHGEKSRYANFSPSRGAELSILIIMLNNGILPKALQTGKEYDIIKGMKKRRMRGAVFY